MFSPSFQQIFHPITTRLGHDRHETRRQFCPLYFLSQLPRSLGFQPKLKIQKNQWLIFNHLYVQFTLLVLGLCESSGNPKLVVREGTGAVCSPSYNSSHNRFRTAKFLIIHDPELFHFPSSLLPPSHHKHAKSLNRELQAQITAL